MRGGGGCQFIHHKQYEDLVYENLGPFRPIGLNGQNLPVIPITKYTSRFVKFGLNLKF